MNQVRKVFRSRAEHFAATVKTWLLLAALGAASIFVTSSSLQAQAVSLNQQQSPFRSVIATPQGQDEDGRPFYLVTGKITQSEYCGGTNSVVAYGIDPRQEPPALYTIGVASVGPDCTFSAIWGNQFSGLNNTYAILVIGQNWTTCTGGPCPLAPTTSSPPAHAYVSNSLSNSVSIIDTSTESVLAAVPVGNIPVATAVTPDGSMVYVANGATKLVSVISTQSMSVVAKITVGFAPVSVAITPDGTHAYVANSLSNSVSVIDTSSNAVIATVGVGQNPTSLSTTPDGSQVLVTNTGSRSVSVISTATNTVTATIPVGTAPVGVTVH